MHECVSQCVSGGMRGLLESKDHQETNKRKEWRAKEEEQGRLGVGVLGMLWGVVEACGQSVALQMCHNQ